MPELESDSVETYAGGPNREHARLCRTEAEPVRDAERWMRDLGGARN
jgi:hypothetical protein